MILPLVSLVIPTYNKARFLAEAIDSVLAQDYPAVETIVIDDGSTDDTRQVLHAYGSRIAVEVQPNQGQSAAINRGWARARGEIVSYLGADDCLRPEAVRRSVEALMACPGVVMTYGDYDLIDARSVRLRRVRAPEYSYEKMLVELVCSPGPGVFIWRHAQEATGLWDRSLRQMPDLDYWLRLGLIGPFRRIPQVLASFRVHAGSLSFATDPGRASEPVQVVEKLFGSGRVPVELAPKRHLALSTAHTIAARTYLRTGHWRSAFRSVAEAARQYPSSLIAPRQLRLLASGLFGAAYYRLLTMRNRVRGQ